LGFCVGIVVYYATDSVPFVVARSVIAVTDYIAVVVYMVLVVVMLLDMRRYHLR